MDRAVVERDGVPVKLEPRFMAVLIRLGLETGHNVARADLYRDALPPQRAGHDHRVLDPSDAERLRRAHVHKAISALRRELGPELVSTDSGANPGYRLELPADNIDMLQFERLVAESRGLTPIRAVRQLERALALWRGRPLVDVAHHCWARRRIAQVTETLAEARRRFYDLCLLLDQADRAVAVGAELLASDPDPELEAQLRRLRYSQRTVGALSRSLALGPGNVVRVVARYGDLLADEDAHLVVGFSDAFETDTTDSELVSRESLQGQLVHRLWDGDFKRLDRDLREALRGVPRTTYRRADKPYGKLWRFDVGTVAPLRQGGRYVFAVAYSRVDATGTHTRSSRSMLRHSMDNVWRVVRERGQFRPVAVPVIGTRLARVDGMRHIDGLRVVLETFLACARQQRLTDELRIVIKPSDEDRIELAQVAALLDELAGKVG